MAFAQTRPIYTHFPDVRHDFFNRFFTNLTGMFQIFFFFLMHGGQNGTRVYRCFCVEFTHLGGTLPYILNLRCSYGGGGTQPFFGGCVPHGFPKVGSRERIFP